MNVNLWFAKDVDNNKIISVVNANSNKEYKCPICDSDVIPKAVESKKITPHFAHIDKSKCSQESMIHFWMKNLFIEVGENFTIQTDKKIQYVCKSFKTEVRYELNSGAYIPDIVVETECGNEIVFEMANTNKKQVKDYIDKWIELDKIVVEVDVKGLVNDDKEFKALYYKGKCFNFNNRDGGYYNTIGKLKESMKSDGRYDIETVRKLDWFWDELVKYRSGESTNKQEMISIIDSLNKESLKTVSTILYKSKCTNIMYDYLDDKLFLFKEKLVKEIKRKLEIDITDRIKSRIEYNRSSNSYKSYIEIYNYEDRCWWMYSDFSKDNVKSMINNIGKDELYRKSKELEDEKRKYYDALIEKIKNKNKLKSFMGMLPSEYKLSIFSKRRTREILSEDDINLEFTLYYDRTPIFWCDIIEHKDDFNFDRVVDNILKPIKEYFKKLNRINECTKSKIYSLSKLIESRYLNYGVTVSNSLYLEDICSLYISTKDIRIFLYLNNNGILDGCRSKNIIASTDDEERLLQFISNIIDKEIENEYKFNCIDCSNVVSISKREVDFFLERKLHIPKRCKSCRNNRKEGKQ